jgi:hypothetical protein
MSLPDVDVSDDALIYEPVDVQRVPLRMPDGMTHLTLTGIMHAAGPSARGPDAGTILTNPYGEGTEPISVLIRHVGPRWTELRHAAVLISGAGGIGIGPSRGTTEQAATSSGMKMTGARPLLVDDRLAVYVELEIILLASVRHLGFQITALGRLEQDAPDGEASPPPDDPNPDGTWWA